MAGKFSLSDLSRGYGTWKGSVIRDTPIFDSDSSENEQVPFGQRKAVSMETLGILHELHRSLSARPYQNKHFKRDIFNQIKSQEAEDASLHKTFSTRSGALLLFSQDKYLARHRKRQHRRTKKRPEKETVELNALGTCEDLTKMILEFGNDDAQAFKTLSRKLHDENMINVRPGYSANRYIASLTQLWDPHFLDKFFTENVLHRTNLQKYGELKLPPIRVEEKTQSPLLKNRPRPYSSFSLPHISLGHTSVDDTLLIESVKSAQKSSQSTKLVNQNIRQHRSNSSTGYPESSASAGTNQKRKRKKTLKMNVLELPGQKPGEAKYVSESDEDSDSELDWAALREASKLAIQKTFDGLDDNITENETSLPTKYPLKQKHVVLNNQVNPVNRYKGSRLSVSSASSSAEKWKETLGKVPYASLDPKQKQDLISDLLLHGAIHEANDSESIASNIDVDTFAKNSSLPINNTPSLPMEEKMSGKISRPETLNSSKMSAVNIELTSKLKKSIDLDKVSNSSGSFPSVQSLRSKSGSNTSMSKGSSHSVLFSSFQKLPPIISEPATPYLEEIKNNVSSQRRIYQVPKFAYVSKKLTSISNKITKDSPAHEVDSTKKGRSLLIHHHRPDSNNVSTDDVKQFDTHVTNNFQDFDKNNQSGPLNMQECEVVATNDPSIHKHVSNKDARSNCNSILRIDGHGFSSDEASTDIKDIDIKFDEKAKKKDSDIDERGSVQNGMSELPVNIPDEERNVTDEGENIMENANLLDSKSVDSGRSTGTGMTDSDMNLTNQGNLPGLEPSMSTVTEESSRSSKRSRKFSREQTLNHTATSLNSKESIQQQSIKEMLNKDDMETQTAHGSSAEPNEEVHGIVQDDKTSEDEHEGIKSDLGSPVVSENADVKYDTDDVVQNDEENMVDMDKSHDGSLEDSTKEDTKDEGVVLEDREPVDRTSSVVSPEMSETHKVTIAESSKSSDTQSIGNLIDDPHDQHGGTHSIGNLIDDPEDQHGGSSVDYEQQSLDQDVEFLKIQAQNAASEALASSMTGTGRDLLQDMKIASKLFESMLQENLKILKKRGRRHSATEINRADTDLTVQGSEQQNLLTIDQLQRGRSRSVIRAAHESTSRSVNIDELKANVQSLEHLLGKKKEKMKHSGEMNSFGKEKTEGSKTSGQFAKTSVTSLPANSIPADVPSEADIQMDIFGYGQPETETVNVVDTSNKKSDNDRSEDHDTSKDHDTNKDNDTSKNHDAIKDHDTRKDNDMSKDNTAEVIDSDEERFRQALQAIVEDVKDLSEDKRPTAKAKIKKKTKKIPNQRPATENHDRLASSPPFHAGKAKEGKIPAGLTPIQEVMPKDASQKGKKKKAVGKDKIMKVKKDENKEQTEDLKPDQNYTLEQISTFDVDTQNTEKPMSINIGQPKIKTAVTKFKNEISEDDSQLKYLETPAIKSLASPKRISEDIEFVFNRTPGTIESSEPSSKLHSVHKGLNSIPSQIHTESETEHSVTGSDTDSAPTNRVTDARLRKRQLAADKRRLEVERKRKEKEEARRKALLESEMEERLRQDAEDEKMRRIEEFKRRKEEEELERKRNEDIEREMQRRLERERAKKRKASEDMRKKMAAVASQLKLEEEFRQERERIALQIEEELKLKEQELLAQMEEEEQIAYQEAKRIEAELKRKEEEEKLRIEEEKRIKEEEELKRKMKELEELQRILLERQAFWDGMRNSKHFLELNQRLTRAFTFSYYDLLPAILFPFVSLRPFSSTDSPKKLPTINEE